MGRTVSLWLVLPLMCCLPSGRPCLQCDNRIHRLHKDFLLSVSASVEEQIELKNIMDNGYASYKETSEKLRGVIDPTTLYRASTEFQSEFNYFQNSEHKDTLRFETIQIMEKGRKILEKHLKMFVRDGLCPNKCGLLYQRLMDCTSCQYKLQTCPSPTFQKDCGVFLVQAEQGGQAVLDCFLPWHSLTVGRAEYHYSWNPQISADDNMAEGDLQTLVVTEDSSVVLNQLHLSERGLYRCLLLDKNGTVLSKTRFLLSVTPSMNSTQRLPITLPSLPFRKCSPLSPPPTYLLLSVISLVTTLSLTASLSLAVNFG
ncbi:izumo sperm-egg fusion protein 1 [Osmerus eperlanus]|uniref:izumo sperm-egg fusion protein 1 n=1 Tax=Osmerus eperlanus TaxID=29151 RepID=UPI002E15BB79